MTELIAKKAYRMQLRAVESELVKDRFDQERLQQYFLRLN